MKKMNESTIKDKQMLIIGVICVIGIAIGCIMEQVEKEKNLSAGLLSIPSTSEAYEGRIYQDVVSDLETIGFTNVDTVVIDDLVFGWTTKDGEIESVSVDGNTEYSAMDAFEPDTKIIVTYHTFPQDDDTGDDSDTSLEEEEDDEDLNNDVPKIILDNEYEEAVYQVVSENNGILTDIGIDKAEYTLDGVEAYCIEFTCGDYYRNVNPILEALSNLIVDNQVQLKSRVVVNNFDGYNLRVLEILPDGSFNPISQTSHYKDERYEWFNGLFSVWDGSNDELNDLIKYNLNDEKSFEHIETKYIDITNEEALGVVVNSLTKAGINATVEIGDVLFITEFSAKNGFDATIKNTAYGLASYATKDVILLAII